MSSMLTKTTFSLALFMALSTAQLARSADVQVFATSYDMRNGVSPNCGCRHYWDRKYAPSPPGSTTTDGYFLTGGLGDLTDGIVTEDHWNIAEELDENIYDLEDTDGIGPYVGWRALGLLNAENNIPEPEVLFHFAGPISFSRVRVHYEDHPSDVFPPVEIYVKVGSNESLPHVPLRDGQGPKWADIDVSSDNMAGNSLLVRFVTDRAWTLIDEVEFYQSGSGALEGDFNRDGRVDAADLAAWSAGFGRASGAALGDGDANGDGDADGGDFLVWQKQFGAVASSTVNSAAIPEPATTLLGACCLAGVLGCRVRRRG